jgi:hypothetical protein
MTRARSPRRSRSRCSNSAEKPKSTLYLELLPLLNAACTDATAASVKAMTRWLPAA